MEPCKVCPSHELLTVSAYNMKGTTASQHQTRRTQSSRKDLLHVRRHPTIPTTNLLPGGTEKHVLQSSQHKTRTRNAYHCFPLGASCTQTHPCLCRGANLQQTFPTTHPRGTTGNPRTPMAYQRESPRILTGSHPRIHEPTHRTQAPLQTRPPHPRAPIHARPLLTQRNIQQLRPLKRMGRRP